MYLTSWQENMGCVTKEYEYGCLLISIQEQLQNDGSVHWSADAWKNTEHADESARNTGFSWHFTVGNLRPSYSHLLRVEDKISCSLTYFMERHVMHAVRPARLLVVLCAASFLPVSHRAYKEWSTESKYQRPFIAIYHSVSTTVSLSACVESLVYSLVVRIQAHSVIVVWTRTRKVLAC
jgi:hypothetical protein